MAWMRSWKLSDQQVIDTYKVAIAACPVNVTVYDGNGQLVARTTTDTITVTDEDGVEQTVSISKIDETIPATIEAAVVGNRKIFILPDDQEYRIEIVRNENYTEGDTMTYSVTTYENNTETSSVVYENISLAAETVFEGNVTTSDKAPETCTLSCDGSYIEPTAVIRPESGAQTIRELDISRDDDDTYLITGKLSAMEFGIIAYCATYSESGQLLHISSQKFTAAQEEQSMKLSVNVSESDNHLKLFFINAQDQSPIDESIIVGL